jgi:hypothetical protein
LGLIAFVPLLCLWLGEKNEFPKFEQATNRPFSVFGKIKLEKALFKIVSSLSLKSTYKMDFYF